MNALWIRVEANEKSSRRVWGIRRALGGIPTPHVVGYLTCLGGEVAQHAPDGDLSDVDDELLEEWAMWDGESGAFAAAFRAACAPEGDFVGWGETMGELVRRREKDRNRKRGASTETPTTEKAVSSDVPRKSADAPRNSGVRNETVRNETVRDSGAEEIQVRGESAVEARTAATAPPAAAQLDEAADDDDSPGAPGDTQRDADFAPLRAAPLAPLVRRLMRERYGGATADRKRDVARQLVAALSSEGVKVKRGQVVRTTPAVLARALELALAEQIREPDRTIVIVLLKCAEGSANLGLDARGRTPTDAAAENGAAERAEAERQTARELEEAAAWLAEHPDVAADIARRVDLELPDRPGLALTRQIRTAQLAAEVRAELAGAAA